MLDRFFGGRHIPAMAGDDPKKLLKLLKDRGFLQDELAARFQTTQQSISRWTKGERKPSGPARKLIRELAIEVGILPLVRASPRAVKIMGRIGAGAHIEPDFEQVPPEGLGEVELTFTPDQDMIAFQVIGDSMLPEYRPGDIVVVHETQRRAINDMIGDEVAVRTADGKRYLKRLFGGSRRSLYILTSKDAAPIIDVRVAWASEIVARIRDRQVRIIQRRGK